MKSILLTFFLLCVVFATIALAQVNTLASSKLIKSYGSNIPLQDSSCTSRNGYPASPKTVAPFTKPWNVPTQAQPKYTYCDTEGRCIDYYELTVKYNPVQVFPTGPASIFRSYNGVLLGPTIKTCKGRQSLVRITNTVDLPVSTHLHGSASAAPYDGWADDVTNTNQTKEYHYPNNRAATLWYHDHAVHDTAINAYSGVAAQYWVKDCLHSAEPIVNPKFDLEMLVGDKVFDANNQLLFDSTGAHKDNLYGDHNTINGVPWPYLNVEPRKYRFRIVNTGITRPYIYRLSGGKNFWVIASDGGLLEKPVQTDYLLHGVAERWEIIIDFSDSAGKNITLLNDAVDSVPMFCQSHLLAQFRVGKTKGSEADPALPSRFFAVGDYPLNSALVRPSLITQAIATKPENRMLFHRSNGQWLINGHGWDQVATRVEVKIKPNELSPWHLVNSAGGWFHPIHLHLIDFIVVKRNNPDKNIHLLANSTTGLDPYEIGAPKDVVYLGPNEDIEVVARYGPEVGRYMFHCHNLVHEDNDMLLAFSVEGSDAGEVPGSPLPVSPFNQTLADPMSQLAKPMGSLPAVTQCYLQSWINRKTYDVFYPAGQKANGNKVINPNNFWEVAYTVNNVFTCCSGGPAAPTC